MQGWMDMDMDMANGWITGVGFWTWQGPGKTIAKYTSLVECNE